MRRVFRAARHRLGRAAAACRRSSSASSTAPASFARQVEPRPPASGSAGEPNRDPVALMFHQRLEESEIAEIEARIAEHPELREIYDAAGTPELRRFLLINFGLWLEAGNISKKTGLSPRQPPDEVHSMARGALAAAGGLYEADLVAATLAHAGVDLAAVARGLDFGCSSGRVVRVFAAAYPQARWQACDPNEPAIEWARATLPWIDFFLGKNEPPLPLESSSLDLVYAISIWSHFAPRLGLRWFDEMHRVLAPGGHLLFTSHGFTSVEYYDNERLRSAHQLREIVRALYRRGWWYAPEFGEQGDWGVVNPEWGTAFLSPEWMLTQLCPRWRVVEFAPGRNQDNQDVYVLQRV
jgi:SAM-dependent methyltransferase